MSNIISLKAIESTRDFEAITIKQPYNHSLMIDKNLLKQKIKEYVRNSTFNDSSRINDDTMIFKEGILDSMGLVTLISFLEEEFNIQAEDSDLVEENFETINAIAEFISRKN